MSHEAPLAQLQTAVEELFAGRETNIARDLKLNLKKLVDGQHLKPDELTLALLAVATALKFEPLKTAATAQAQTLGIAPESITEAGEAAAIMGMLNNYYRFRHLLTEGQGEEHVATHYKAAGLRMNALGKPLLGNRTFEMLAFAVSVLGGCASCINAHEQELRKHDVAPDAIHELARLASVTAGTAVLAEA